MKFTTLTAALAAALFAGPALAEGDAAKGEKEFGKCKTCHMIVAADGTEIVKGPKTGPNLWGVIGRQVAGYEGFDYGPSLKSVGETGAVWDAAMLVAYIKDPVKWLKETTGDSKAKSKMSFKLAKGGEDVAAYLETFATPATN
ncbi:MAG TPA: cytochrome C [Paracoccaceae bacterium]|nr:cytochrome C [Paracoccaceae bacterium]HMO71146.1 cytochrome C [Paracoccaceae bacterium]